MSSSISIVESSLPPGFRFHPRDDELVCDYLINKVSRSPFHSRSPLLVEVDLNKCEPWDIPPTTCVGGKEWYFYSHLDRKYATGSRTNRATASGYWKATGKDRPILRKGSLVGMRKTLVFYRGRAPKGRKTDWVMHEFRVDGSLPHLNILPPHKDEWVLCRVFHKSGNGNAGSNSGVDGEQIASSSPPPLMDPNIGSDPASTGQYEQVPCFSIFSIDQMDPQFSDTGLLQPSTLQNYANTYGEITDSATSLDPCAEKVLNSVLSHLTRMENIPGHLV
ncbi:hypothetical protein MLD38_021941 [Melastoma candidum]|uniref:Uncharacterized protein n=1 Tax=Melastoma candidum TaxID=119954 RepID=A0ACB9QJG6_9MYRT|nr:hypothetical protein MLD38_021941 [Melastoma candidum]